jgi:hypothetical protein
MTTKSLVGDAVHAAATHERWSALRNRRQEDSNYRDEWYAQQCGACRFFAPLSGGLGSDYGGCSNPASKFDSRVMFEHDGCESFSDAEEWCSEGGPLAKES